MQDTASRAREYEDAKAFWNSFFAETKPEAILGKKYEDTNFNALLRAGLDGAQSVLDYGCGDGWGLFEMYHTKAFTQGLGIDASENGVRYANECVALSNLGAVLQFAQGDAETLGESAFDFILTVNVLDVIPAQDCERILAALYRALKPGRRMLVCLNPEFTHEDLTGWIGMEQRGEYYYKNGILRAHSQTRAQWTRLFERFFTVERIETFILQEREKEHPRVGYLLKKEFSTMDKTR